MKSSNPALKQDLFSSSGFMSRTAQDHMTVDGAVQKTGILVALICLSAGFVWSQIFSAAGLESVPALQQGQSLAYTASTIGVFGGLILALATIFKPVWAPYTAPAYAVLEGLALGGISSIFEMKFPGIVVQATLLTFGTLVTMLMAYKAGVIQATEKFRSVVVRSTGAIAFTYLASMILGFFGVQMSFLHDSSPLSIGISLVVIVVAAMNLILDFDMIEKGASQRAPKHMEWYSAFSLILTLVWLYLEFLRLLSKLNSRD